jgi:hypothetical protein
MMCPSLEVPFQGHLVPFFQSNDLDGRGWGALMLEIRNGGTRRTVDLEAHHTSSGRAPSNDIVLEDPQVSALHAVVDQLSAGCVFRDLGSANGTFVNGKRIADAAVLRHGDQVRLGTTDIIYRGPGPGTATKTTPLAAAPSLTAREHDVLVALCRPLAEGDLFCEPATASQVAQVLMVSEDAVKKDLVRLYRKFGIHDASARRRRTRLANAALTRGAITLSQLRD